MRKYTIPQSMVVEYMVSTSSTRRLGDHLGSTSITTDSSGNKVSEMRYKPWGEVRYSWTAGTSTTPAYMLSSYTFTSQYSYMDDPTTSSVTEGFGLLFYNARFYDPALGRFTSADTIIPGGVQGYDRYAYTSNNPLRYIDPTGHDYCTLINNNNQEDCEAMNPTTSSGGGGSDGGNDDEGSPPANPGVACGLQGVYSPSCSGWHSYITTNVVCLAEWHCTQDEMIYYLSLFAYPGQDPSDGPFVPGSRHSVSWPGTNISMGSLGAIVVSVENGGFTTVNKTLPTHILYDGRVDRTMSQLPDGSWIVTTHGYGNNKTRYVVVDLQRPDLDPLRIPVNLSSVNGWGGPILPGGVDIFDQVDTQMLNYIQANH